MAPAVPDSAVCVRCGYSLRGLPNPVCPECGEPFDPQDPFTWRDYALWERWAAFVGSWRDIPARWLVRLLVAVLIAVLFRFSSLEWGLIPHDRLVGPREPISWCHMCAVVLLGIAATWYLVVRSRWSAVPGMSGVGIRRRRLAARHWCVFGPAAVMIAGLTFFPGWAFALRWAASKPFFEMKAREMRMEGEGHAINRPQVIGLYLVWRVAVLADGRVKFEVGPDWALTYSIEHPPSVPHRDLGPGWSEMGW